MADENPPAPSDSPEDVTKSETIRITLPAKSDQPAVKRETVRINVPGKPVPPVGAAPKKETTKLPVGGVEAGGSPEAPKPFAPPPRPPGPPMAPKPLGAAPPKPPALGGRPTVPLKPGPGSSGGPTPEPVTQKSAAPKKETARITLPPEGAKPPLPKATVKMQPTQPLTPRPSAIQQAPTIATVPSAMTSAVSTGPAADPLVGPLSILTLIISLACAALVYMAYAATGAQ
jgi:hypothetical protein